MMQVSPTGLGCKGSPSPQSEGRISSSFHSAEMSQIPCAFKGNINRIDTCQGNAAVFFRSAKGTIWPLCLGCAERHKETAVQLVADNTVEVQAAVGATFDIPLTDPDAQAAYKVQDPARIARIIEAADAAFAKRSRAP